MRKQELLILIVVITICVFIFLTYMLLSLFSNPESQTPAPSASLPSQVNPSQTIPFPNPSIEQPSLAPQIPNGLTKDELINLLPIQTPLFNIEYYYQDDLFKVSIKENPYEANKKEAQDWFRNLGFNPDELNIYWFAFPEVRK